jgi:2-methylcitrate dehydratase
MHCSEEPAFTADYHDPEKRSIANSLTLTLGNGSTFTETVEYPLGHRRRRSEGIPLLEAKFRTNLGRRFSPQRQQAILEASLEQQALECMPVQEYVDLYAL